MDVCEGLGGGLVTGLCRLQLPGNASVFSLPYGLATGPGMELACSSLEESKYCVNYLLMLPTTCRRSGRSSSWICSLSLPRI